MRKVKIFIGSSIEELKADRIEIGNFFRQLNDLYLDNGLYFQLIMCEDYDDAIELEGKQSKYDKEILDSELSVFIFYKKVGVYTEHEFEIAYKQFKAELRPKILTVFKCAKDTTEVIADVKNFADKLDRELKHYYKTYDNPDSLKLWLIMQIKSMNLDQNKVEFKNGKVVVNDETLAIYSNAPAFKNNQVLADKKAQLEAIKKDYLRLKVEYLEKPDDIDVYLKYCDIVKQKNQLEEDIEQGEKELVNQLQNIYKVTEKGDLSERQILGYRLMEAGKYQEALAVLDRDEIFSEMNKNEQMLEFGNAIIENAKNALQTNVNEILQRIKTLKINGITLSNQDEISELFEKSYNVSLKYELESDVFFEYSSFLTSQKKFKRALEVVESVKERVEKLGSWEEKVDLWDSLALNLYNVGQREESYAYYEKALKTANGLVVMDSSEKNIEQAARIAYDFSLAKGSNWSIDQAIEYVKQAIEKFEILHEINNEKYATNLALCYTQYAWGLGVNKSEGVLDYYKKAYDLVKKLWDKQELTVKQKRHFISVSKNYSKHLTYKTLNFSKGSESREIFDFAYSVACDLAKQNPVGFDMSIAGFHLDYALLLTEYCAEEPVEQYYVDAYKAYLRMKTAGTLTRGYLYTRSVECLAKYYESQKDERSKEYYEIAVESYNQMASDVIVHSQRNRANYYYYAGMIYRRKLGDFKNCAIVLKKSIELYKGLSDYNKDDEKWVNYMLDDFKVYNLDKYLEDN